MRTKIFGIILAATFVLSACKTSTTADTSYTNVKKAISSSDVVLVDVRTPEQYSQGTADNAINIPLADIQAKAESLKGKKVVVFCNKGIQADEAFKILKKKGVDVYDGTSLQNVKAIQDRAIN
ncbi:rhodanese-like domain-containing protein [Chryseobacterium sp. JUb7]|uniref:rhodanese-like domain-containing protein n=1 Tax=Chryseobacterium sp. JUb7 TaxID=2940599 RepID=UPI00216944D8|nr:rhodanese-like domain-containing protein [Chryseobacterium sp. JUb7]MCS3530373.1 rhodanese-related sulfurtransferase [Chryseobacterium sp. JUb7]